MTLSLVGNPSFRQLTFQPRQLGVIGTTKAKTREVWLTEEEIPTVREAVYAARMAKGLRTGIPRNRLVLVGGE